jgi:ribosome-binding protein aMBF1 (putative translation factor)
LSRKTPKISALNDLLWQRISEVLEEKGLQYVDLWRKLPLNKNTRTAWKNKRTIPDLADLEQLAHSLGVQHLDLLRSSSDRTASSSAEKLELPFEPGSKGVKIEVQATSGSLVLRLLERP